MKFSNVLMVGLLSLGTIAISALPSLARPGSIFSGANLREAPSVSSQLIDSLPKGTPLEILQVIPARKRDVHSWYYIRSSGNLRTEGWVASNLITVAPSNATYGHLRSTTPGDVINIRSAPNLQSQVLHTGVTWDLVQVGESRFVPFSRDSRTGYYWYNITYANGASGWVRGDLINVWSRGCMPGTGSATWTPCR